MSMKQVIEIARGDIGEMEWPAGSNRTVFGERYGMNGQPWCVIWLWDVFQRAGERMAFFGGGKTASCSILLRWYREQGLTVGKAEVQEGDIVFLNFHGKSDPEHCGLVTKVLTYFGLEVFTIEGNTSPSDGSQSNGGMVCEKQRNVGQIVAVCRPQYQPEPVTVDDITGHWAEESIRFCVEHGLMNGYPDGSFQPDKPITRAELATVISRLY